MEIITPLGDDALLFHGMHAREELSRMPEFQLDLLSVDPVKFENIVSKNVTVKVQLQDESTRYFNGFVSRFSAGGRAGRYIRYTATVHPWTWFLTRRTDCRIFQAKNVPDIVKDVFTRAGFNDFTFELVEAYKEWNYCVQYRETDFNFVSRLLEHEGIYYYYRHEEGKHTLVMTDALAKHTPVSGYETVRYIAPEQLVRPDIEHINRWEQRREVQPEFYEHTDYDFERPSVPLLTKSGSTGHRVYDYPGYYTQKPQGEQWAHVRLDEFRTQFESAVVSTNARGMTVGALFKLADCPHEEPDSEHLVLASTHDLEYSEYEAMPHGGGSDFRCTFVAMSSKQQFRPRRATPKPFVQGPQTAVVVGPSGEQIYTDKYGRVKVQFHWDREGKKDAKSSCWIRVSHPWAGKGWGSVSTPRIGQEVIVDFLEGDPDQPIITGRVYNGENPPPFGFPAGAVISGVKSDTHKGGGFNEVSLDDTAGKERVFIHGQFDMNTVVEHDQTTTVHNCRTDRVDVDDSESIGNHQKWDVGVNRDATIGSNETLSVGANRTKKIGANETITVGSNRDASIGASESLTVALQRTHSVGINETITVGAAQEVTVGAMQAITVGANQTVSVGVNQSTTVGASQSFSVGAGQTTSVGANQGLKVGAAQSVEVGGAASLKVGGDNTIKVSGGRSSDIGGTDATKAGKEFVVDAGDSILLKTGSASITMKKDGTITIKGKDITIEGSGKISVKASSEVTVKGSKVHNN
jgi:type VI secretion system secreted protein VgrG